MQSESEAFIRSVLESIAISSANLISSALERMPLRWRACMARTADSLSAFARLCVGASVYERRSHRGIGQSRLSGVPIGLDQQRSKERHIDRARAEMLLCNHSMQPIKPCQRLALAPTFQTCQTFCRKALMLCSSLRRLLDELYYLKVRASMLKLACWMLLRDC